ncbi:MAG: hypothetical protein AAF546_00065 [Verrucomicrobiota bacterium]
MNALEIIAQELEDGWQVSAVWIVPPQSHVSQTKSEWELHIKRADWVAIGEGNSPIKINVDQSKIPDGVKVLGREKVGDVIVTLPAMSAEQADAIAAEIKKASDANGVVKTPSGCWSIGPCASWVRDPLRRAIINGRSEHA